MTIKESAVQTLADALALFVSECENMVYNSANAVPAGQVGVIKITAAEAESLEDLTASLVAMTSGGSVFTTWFSADLYARLVALAAAFDALE